MRLKEPFRGLYLMGGHTIFHIALLVASLLLLGFPEDTKGIKNTLKVINQFRVAHGIDIFFAIIMFLGSAPQHFHKYRFTFRVLDTVKLFVYMGAIMYAIFHEQKELVKDKTNKWDAQAEMWVLVELLVFFGQVLCSVFFLIGMQIRGEFGYDLDPNVERYKHDTLTFYEKDIAWFSQIFVMWNIHLFVLFTDVAGDVSDLKKFFSAYSLILRSTHFYFLMPLFSDKRELVEKSNKVWGILGFFQIVGCFFIFGFKSTRQLTTASGLVDIIIFIGQYVNYMIHAKAYEQKVKKAEESPKDKLLGEAPKPPKIKHVVEHEIDNSVFDLAFVSMIDPVLLDEWNKKYPGKYMQRIDMDRTQITAIFQGMLICVMIQVIAVTLLIIEFSENLQFKSDRFLLLIPKLISCFYMHNILAEEIKDGQKIMKYVINHPDHFERRELDKDQFDSTSRQDGKYTRITYAFLLGFIQYSIAVSLELMSIIFLNSLDSYRLIIVCYASLTAVANFDNMFAAAMDSHPIKAASGKMLRVGYHRYMQTQEIPEEEASKVTPNDTHFKEHQRKENPRKGNCYLIFLRGIFKLIRMFHVSIFFYFAPFFMLFYQFYFLEVSA